MLCGVAAHLVECDQVQEEEKLDLFAFDWPGIGDGGSISLGNVSQPETLVSLVSFLVFVFLFGVLSETRFRNPARV